MFNITANLCQTDTLNKKCSKTILSPKLWMGEIQVRTDIAVDLSKCQITD